MINKLKEINEKLILLYKDNDEQLNKQLLIKKILKEPNCFFKMNIELAYSILRDLQFKNEEIKNIYLILIDEKNYSA